MAVDRVAKVQRAFPCNHGRVSEVWWCAFSGKWYGLGDVSRSDAPASGMGGRGGEIAMAECIDEDGKPAAGGSKGSCDEMRCRGGRGAGAGGRDEPDDGEGK